MIIIIQGQANSKTETIWFNPPFSKNIATKIGRYSPNLFLNLIGKYFPQEQKFQNFQQKLYKS